jgi:hypothetical protein
MPAPFKPVTIVFAASVGLTSVHVPDSLIRLTSKHGQINNIWFSVVVQFDFNAASQPNNLGLIRPLAEM